MLHSCTTIKRQDSGVVTQPSFSLKQGFYAAYEIRNVFVGAFKDRQATFSHGLEEGRQEKKKIRTFVKPLTFRKGP